MQRIGAMLVTRIFDLRDDFCHQLTAINRLGVQPLRLAFLNFCDVFLIYAHAKSVKNNQREIPRRECWAQTNRVHSFGSLKMREKGRTCQGSYSIQISVTIPFLNRNVAVSNIRPSVGS